MPVGDASACTFRPPFGTSGVSHCEDEQPLALLARANFLRREKSRLNREAKSGKLSVNDVEAEAEVPGDVLEQDHPGAATAR
jgi:hypothetical protein